MNLEEEDHYFDSIMTAKTGTIMKFLIKKCDDSLQHDLEEEKEQKNKEDGDLWSKL